MLEQIFPQDDLVTDLTQAGTSPMRKFYRGKTVFLTGGTGFLGKLFIEKLLRCEVREVILLVRAKRDKTPRERVQWQLEREAIYVSYAKNPESYWSRLRVMEGALEYEKLNLSEIDIEYLHKNVDVVIHSAANVSLDVSLKAVIKANVFGTDELLKIALGMKQLVSFLYISTAYCNCTKEVVDEKFYDPNMDPMSIVKVAAMVDEGQLDALSRKIIHPWPNTYTYAKAMAENVVREFSGQLPVAVIRPSIVVSTMKDPIEGWTDNVYGLNGLNVGSAVGVLRIMRQYDEYHTDVVPADLVVNSSLAVIWYTTKQQSQVPPDGNVFNCTSRLDNPLTSGDIYHYSKRCWMDIPSMQLLWYPSYNTVTSTAMYNCLKILYHFIPALFFDLFLKLKGRKPKILSLYRKIQQFTVVLDFFLTHEWIFVNDRMRQVYASMAPEDADFFPSDMRTIKWIDFFNTYSKGLRKYILRESMDTVEKAKRNLFKLWVAHCVFLGLVYLAMTYLAYTAFTSFKMLGMVWK